MIRYHICVHMCTYRFLSIHFVFKCLHMHVLLPYEPFSRTNEYSKCISNTSKVRKMSQKWLYSTQFCTNFTMIMALNTKFISLNHNIFARILLYQLENMFWHTIVTYVHWYIAFIPSNNHIFSNSESKRRYVWPF